MIRNWQQRKAALAKEKKWVDSYQQSPNTTPRGSPAKSRTNSIEALV
jgi:hypothetical protein